MCFCKKFYDNFEFSDRIWDNLQYSTQLYCQRSEDLLFWEFILYCSRIYNYFFCTDCCVFFLFRQTETDCYTETDKSDKYKVTKYILTAIDTWKFCLFCFTKTEI